MLEPEGDLVEINAIQECYADNIDYVNIGNGMFRCTFYSLQVIPPAHDPVKVAVAKIVMPLSGASDAAKKALAAIAMKALTSPGDMFGQPDCSAMLS